MNNRMFDKSGFKNVCEWSKRDIRIWLAEMAEERLKDLQDIKFNDLKDGKRYKVSVYFEVIFEEEKMNE